MIFLHIRRKSVKIDPTFWSTVLTLSRNHVRVYRMHLSAGWLMHSAVPRYPTLGSNLFVGRELLRVVDLMARIEIDQVSRPANTKVQLPRTRRRDVYKVACTHWREKRKTQAERDPSVGSRENNGSWADSDPWPLRRYFILVSVTRRLVDELHVCTYTS